MSNICKNCGCTLDDNDTSCINCGTPIEKTKKSDNKNRNILIITISISLAIIIAIVGLVLILTNNNNDSDDEKINNKYTGKYKDSGSETDIDSNNSSTSDKEVFECPDFVGMTIEEVEDHEYYDLFKFKWSQSTSAEYDVGVVIKQSPAPDKKIKKGATIRLTVNMGDGSIEVPDVVGKEESYAISTLKAKGFTTKVTVIPHDTIEEGHVVKTNPERTTVVEKGATITVYISSGKEIKMIGVPNVIGLSKGAAEKLIEKAGLIAEFIEITPGSEESYIDVPKGYVLAQDPVADSNEKLLEGSVVRVYVSNGVIEKYVIMPNVVGLDRDGAESMLQEAGLKVKIIEIEVDDSDIEYDTVLYADYNADELIPIGSTVTIQVSVPKKNIE